LQMFFDLDRQTIRERVAQALADTRLDVRYAQRYPDQLSGGERQPLKPPSPTQACAFAGRCPWQPGAICEKETPPWRVTPAGKAIRCHLPLSELSQRASLAPVALPPVVAPASPIVESPRQTTPS
jgi:ABC-type dipeptide/oligopeptide/nickel transport system ATPase component